MNEGEIRELRARLHDWRQALKSVAATGAEAAQPVELDQARVGRLSRMDALQAQAMAKAVDQRRHNDLRRIAAALERIGDDEYGYCLACGEDVAIERLRVDPATTLCIECAEKAEPSR